jgi:hypothetical protein
MTPEPRRLHTSPDDLPSSVAPRFTKATTSSRRPPTLFAEGPPPAESFFGHCEGVTPDGVESGAALIRFSDGSEADAILAAVDSDRGGFRLTSGLRDLSRGV